MSFGRCSTFILFVEIPFLVVLGTVVSATLHACLPSLHPKRGFITATLFSIVSPTCLCSSFPTIVTIPSPWLRYYSLVLSTLLSPWNILYSFTLMGIKFSVLRLIFSILFAMLSATILKKATPSKPLSPSPTSAESLYRPSTPCSIKTILSFSTYLFRLALVPILFTWIVTVVTASIISTSLIGKWALFPNLKVISLIGASLLRFCYGQEVFVLKAIQGLNPNLGFLLGFSLASTGFCLSSLPFYLRILPPKGVFLYFCLVIGTSLFLSLF